MAFDRKLAPEFCEKLQQGIDENVIATYNGLSLPELYNLVEFEDIEVARKYLKHFCRGYINNICLSWPNFDEHFCNVSGYEIECPLKKSLH